MHFETFSCLLNRLTTIRVLVLLFVLYLYFPTVLFPNYPPAGVAPLDLLFSYPPSDAYFIISGYGETGRTAYLRTELTLDIAYPLIYSLLLSIALNYISRAVLHPQSALQKLRFLPFAVALLDILENLAIVALLSQYPQHNDALVIVASLLTSTKWILVGICSLLLLSGLFFWLFRRVSESRMA